MCGGSRLGRVHQTDWPLNHPGVPAAGRHKFEQKVVHFSTVGGSALVGNDDVVRRDSRHQR